MHKHRPSRTSSMVAIMRALADGGITEVDDFRDPAALLLLSPGWRRWCACVIGWMRRRPKSRARLLKRMGGRMDLVALRTRAIDAVWENAHAQGARQLVLLGAGLDGRAYRLSHLVDCAVLEIDHPATQALKRRRCAALTSPAVRHVFAAVDLAGGGLEAALEQAGHQRTECTCWIWEGVTMYLSEAVVRTTLEVIARSSRPGSLLVMTYLEPETRTLQLRGAKLLTRRVGEPLLGCMGRREAARFLLRAGFAPVQDSGEREWREAYTKNPRAPVGLGERLIIGRLAEAGAAC